ncbi:NACHT, LRR and PYD domains-containing protein 3-like [Hydra vulgaris]|uniref:NACHT, LRR and PYD domains-containing protein 3-like n=1 Tax=Hydra vulgaris TaxID=6087 RepID=UPI0032E9FDD2
MDDKKYKDILLKISVNLLDRDVEAIKFYYSKQIGDADLERITTPIKLIQILEQRMLLGIDNYNSFVEVLTKIGRNDLVIYFFEISNSPNKDSNISFKKDLLRMSAELKKFYLNYYGKIGELQPLLKASANVDLIQKFIDLCIVDAVNAQIDAYFSVERKEFLEKQIRYTPIPYSDIFMKEKPVILISGIAGIGKTWLLRKCLLDWSNDLIWKNVELVFYLECRILNSYANISNINELLNIFYKDIVNDFKFSSHTALFIIDGLDEFKYFNELLNPSLTSTLIVKVLREIQKYKHVIAGRVYAIDQYQSISTEHSDKLTIQVMGFNENGINNYVENHVIEEKKEFVKTTLKESSIAKAMASVPFYLSSMCKIISDSKKIDTNSFLTMTDLYTNIFLYFLRKHIIKNNKLIYEIMEDSSNKKYILNICKIAYKMFVNNKIIFSKDEIQAFINDFDKNEGNFFGFIERIETDLGCYYQFAHLTIMEFCASVYAYNCLSSDEIMANERLKISCLSMICGLANKNPNSLLKFLVNLDSSKKHYKESSFLFSILDRLSESDDYKDRDLFIECFYESQSSFNDEIKSIVDQGEWIWGGEWIFRLTMEKLLTLLLAKIIS